MTKSNKTFNVLFFIMFFVIIFSLAACVSADQKAATSVDELIDALPAEVTLADEDVIAEARDEYEKLTDTQKGLVKNLDALVEKETEITNLEAIKEVEDAINKIPSELTFADEIKIVSARAKYNALSSELKARVSNYLALQGAENAYEEMENSRDKINNVNALIADLPAVEDLTLEDEEDITAAKAAYDLLSTDEKASVTGSDKLFVLVTVITQMKNEKVDRDAIEAVELLISLLSYDATLEDKDDVLEARDAYEDLTGTQKEQVTSLNKLEIIERRIANLEYADVVTTLIAELKEELTLTDEDDVIAARNAYDDLTETQKGFVTNYDRLVDKEKEMEIVKNPDLAILLPILDMVPRHIIDDFELPKADGVLWGYKTGEDDSLYDLDTGELLVTTFGVKRRVLEVTYNETTVELEIDFGLVQEGFTAVYYVGGSAAYKPEGGNNWDGHGTWEDQLTMTGFGGYIIEYKNKVYFITKNAFIGLVGTEENEMIDRETLRPYGLETQNDVNNNGLVNGEPKGYLGTAALYYNAGNVPIKFYGCDTYGRVNAAYAGYGKVVFSKQADGSYKVGPMIPEHGGSDDPGNAKGTIDGDYIITLNPGDYLWTPHTWESDYGNAGFGTRLCGAQGVLEDNTPIVIKKYKMILEDEVE